MRLLILGLLLAAADPLPAQAPESPAERDNVGNEPRERRLTQAWNALSPERREALLRSWERFQALSAEERRRIQERFEIFRRLPEKEKTRLRERHERLKALPAAERAPWLKRSPAQPREKEISMERVSSRSEEQRERRRELRQERGSRLQERRAERRENGGRKR